MNRLVTELPHRPWAGALARDGQRGSRRKRARNVWLSVHLYVALGVGFVFVLLGLTGSYNAFMYELDEVWNPDLVVLHPGSAYRTFDEMLAVVKIAHPEVPGPWFLQMPRRPGRAG